MNTTLAIVGTAIVVTAGRIVKGEGASARVFVGGGFAAVFLAILNGPAPQVARGLAALMFLSSLFVYGTPIATAVGAVR